MVDYKLKRLKAGALKDDGWSRGRKERKQEVNNVNKRLRP
jgi:hypothetical protein